MDSEDLSDEVSSASSVDFDDLTDWKTVKVKEACRENSGQTVVLTYRPRQFIARGNFGDITRILTIDRRTYALKRIDNGNRCAMQEIEIMKILKHQNLVKIFYHYKERFDKNHVRIFIIMEFVPRSLVNCIAVRHERKKPFTHLELVLILYQLFRGLAHMHHRNIAHRDIKPHNILIDVREQLVKICDFGFSKNLLRPRIPNVTYICSRWYRAPELLMQNENYTTKVDIWSSGCVLGELILLRPMFPGADSVDQWACIKDILGSAREDEMSSIGMRPTANDRVVKKRDLAEVFNPTVPKIVVDLAAQLLRLDHTARPSAWDAMAHPAFDILKTHEVHASHPHLFNFSAEELTYVPSGVSSLF